MIGLRTFPFRMIKKSDFSTFVRPPVEILLRARYIVLRTQRWIRYSPSFFFFFLRDSVYWVIMVIVNLSLLSWVCVPYTQTGYPTPSYSGSYRILFSSLVAGENFATTLGILHSTNCRCSGPCQAMVNLAWVGGRDGWALDSQQVKR